MRGARTFCCSPSLLVDDWIESLTKNTEDLIDHTLTARAQLMNIKALAMEGTASDDERTGQGVIRFKTFVAMIG